MLVPSGLDTVLVLTLHRQASASVCTCCSAAQRNKSEYFFIGEAEKQSVTCIGSLLKFLHWLGQGQARSWELNPGPAHEWQEPNYLSRYGCLPGSALAGSWKQELELGVEHRRSSVGRRHLSHHADHLLGCVFNASLKRLSPTGLT